MMYNALKLKRGLKMKRFSRKQLLIGGSALLLLFIIGGFVLLKPEKAQQTSKASVNTLSSKSKTDNKAVTSQDPAQTEQATTTETTTTAQAPTNTNAPETTPAPANAGEKGTPVTDKTGAMTSAGITEQASADKVIATLSNWRYETDGSKTLCAAIPASKMARFGADYLTNPVTQLKYCDWLAKTQYTSWEKWASSLGL